MGLTHGPKKCAFCLLLELMKSQHDDAIMMRQQRYYCGSLLAVVIYCLGLLAFFPSAASSSSSSSLSHLDDILAQGDALLAQGQIERAIAVYRTGLDDSAVAAVTTIVDEDEPEKKNRSSSSSTIVVLLSLYTNLGTALSSLPTDVDHAAAVESYQSALQLYRRHSQQEEEEMDNEQATAIAASAAFYLGMVYQDMSSGKAEEAIAAYSMAIALDDGHWAAAANRGSVQQDVMKDYRGALASYNLAYGILTNVNAAAAHNKPPTDPPDEPHVVLSQLQYRIGLCISYSSSSSFSTSSSSSSTGSSDDDDDAVVVHKCIVEDDPEQRPVDCRELAAHAFALAVQYDETNEFARHMLASLTADATVSRASNAYVTALFDGYAANFEHSLVTELKYDGFARLRRGFDRAMVAGASIVNGSGVKNKMMFDVVLDAGCGTGLAGEQFRNISTTLIGVDLSRAILDEATSRRPGLYDEVIAGDVIQILHDRARTLSLIIAADSFIYFGNLDPLLAALHAGLTDDADAGRLAAFTLENVSVDDEQVLATTKSDWRWQLTASGRFAHRKDYVVATAQSHGFAVLHYEPLTDFRFESGVGVRGHLFVLRKLARLEDNDEL